MDIKKINFTKVIKEMELTDFIYLGVICLLSIITVTVFFYSTNFVITNVNKTFLPSEKIQVQALDMGNYSIVVKKLNLPTNTL